MQPERVRLAAEWRAAAAEDARVARLLTQESPSTAAFHAQQAAEKALKAACVRLIDDAPRTHVVLHLLDELRTNGVVVEEPVRAAAMVLERYYIPTRYPDALGGISPTRIFVERDAVEAVAYAETILAFADQLIAGAARSDS